MYAPVLLHACARVWLVRVCACGGGTAPRRDGLVMGYPLLTVGVPTILPSMYVALFVAMDGGAHAGTAMCFEM